MEIENTKQTLAFPAHLLLAEPMPDALRQLTSEYYKLPEEGQKSYKDLFNKEGHENIKEGLTNLGVSYPWDVVNCTLSLGALLFDCCIVKAPEQPKAPMALYAHQKKYNDLAALLMQDSFEVPEWVLKTAKEVLNSDADWQKVFGTTQYKKLDDSVAYMTLNNEAVKYFNFVILEAIKVLA